VAQPFIAKTGTVTSGGTDRECSLQVMTSADGVRMVVVYPGSSFGNSESMTMSWQEWDRLAAWVAYARAEAAVDQPS
jgi:hypothetical protein